MYPPCTVRAGALHNACLVAATEVVEANRTHSGVLEQECETVTLTVTPEREGLRVYTRGGEDPMLERELPRSVRADPQMQFPRLHCISYIHIADLI